MNSSPISWYHVFSWLIIWIKELSLIPHVHWIDQFSVQALFWLFWLGQHRPLSKFGYSGSRLIIYYLYASDIPYPYSVWWLLVMINIIMVYYYLLQPLFCYWTWIGAFKGISRWIHGVFVVIISGFGISDSICILSSCFWAKEMMV